MNARQSSCTDSLTLDQFGRHVCVYSCVCMCCARAQYCTAVQNRLDELRAAARDRHLQRETEGLPLLASADADGEHGLFSTMDLNKDGAVSMTEVR